MVAAAADAHDARLGVVLRVVTTAADAHDAWPGGAAGGNSSN